MPSDDPQTRAAALPDERGTARGRQLLRLSLLAAVVLTGAYVAFVLTSAGQSFDDQSLVGRLAEPGVSRTVRRLLEGIDRGTLIVMVLVLVVVGLARHRRPLALASAGAFAGAVITAEVLKRVLPRPELAPQFADLIAGKEIDTYPSGHATIATAFVLALVMVSRSTIRPVVAVLGLLWCSLIAAGTVAAGWHRPSDAIGGIALALAWVALSAGLLAARRGLAAEAGRLAGAVPWLVLGVLAVSALAVATSAITGDDARVPAEVSWWLFPLGQVMVDAVAVAAVGSFTWLLRDVQFGAPRGAEAP